MPIDQEARARGGRTAAERMTAEERSARSRLAASARWKNRDRVLREAFKMPVVCTVAQCKDPGQPWDGHWRAELQWTELYAYGADRDEAIRNLTTKVCLHMATAWAKQRVVVDLPALG